MPDLQLIKKITKSTDVSAAFDNCFFNAFALHHVTNKLDLPVSLFAVHEQDSNEIKVLKTFFSDINDLDLFETYGEHKLPKIMPSLYLFEKTMILGILLRSWFVSELLKDEVNKHQLFATQGGDSIPFANIIEVFNELGDDSLEIIGEQALYLANKDFFAGRCAIKPTDDINKLQQYWLEQGYDNYCRYLAQPGVKITRDDVRPVFASHAMSYTIYDKNTATKIASYEADNNSPAFELALDVLAAHYFLIPAAENTQALLTQYSIEHTAYQKDRESVLASIDNNKIALCEAQPSVLLVATLRPEYLKGQSALKLLVKKIDTIKTFVNAMNVETLSLVEALSPVEKEIPDALAVTEESTLLAEEAPLEINEPVVDERLSFADDVSFLGAKNSDPDCIPSSEENSASEGSAEGAGVEIPLQPPSNANPKPELVLNQQETIFAAHLNDLRLKSLYFRGKKNKKKYESAAQETESLYIQLDGHFQHYLHSNKTEKEYEKFKNDSLSAIKEVKKNKILQHHRGAKEIIGNLTLAVLGIGVIYLAAGIIKYVCTGNFLLFRPNTDTTCKVKKIKESFNVFEHPESSTFMAGA